MAEKEPKDIVELFWENLGSPSEEGKIRLAPSRIQQLYDHGFVDSKRCPENRWQELFRKLPTEEGYYLIRRKDLSKFTPFLYKGPIRRPFDPQKLKDAIRPPAWLQEMYQKVLRFETVLKLAEWNQLIHTQIKKRFFQGENFVLNKEAKDFLSTLLDQKASPLRRLEVWVFQGPPETSQKEPPPAPKPSSSSQIQDKDRFERVPVEAQKMRAIEKRYYSGEGNPPKADDKETLDILDELAQMESEEDLEFPEPEK